MHERARMLTQTGYHAAVRLSLLCLAACSAAFPDAGPGEYAELEIKPGENTVYTSPLGVEPVDFRLTGRRVDGSEEAIPEAEWTLSNRTVGAVDAFGAFTASTENGGVSYLTARYAGLEANALLTVIYQDEAVGEGVDPTVFDAPKIPHTGLWLYPQNGVNLPRNTPSIVFQWADVGATAAKLRFRSAVTDLTVYTTGTSWTADETSWAALVGTNAGGAVEVELSLAVGTEVWSEEIITLNVNRFDARGTIYYWSTSAYGIMQIPYGEEATDFVTVSTTGYCVGCHSARAGKIAFTYDGGNGSLGIKRVADQSDILAYASGTYGNFNTFSPDGNYLLIAYMGALLLLDANTGAYLGEVPTGGYATHPDWSPDGNAIVFTQTNADGGDWYFSGGRICIMEKTSDGGWTTPVVLYDPPDPYNAYYPAFSPDGEWVAFDVSTGDSYDDADALVHVVARNGGTAIELTAANLASGYTNSIPKWGPLPDDDIMWIAFSSKRNYGAITAGNPQLWVAGFDPVRAEAGEDPSWAAFWLPGQNTAQNNHVPAWAE